MKEEKEVIDYINSLEGVTSSHLTTDDKVIFYKVADNAFASIALGTRPLQVSLRCDEMLSDTLRLQHETVMPSRKLDPAKWNMVLLTGQLDDEQIKGLILHAYQLAQQSD